SGWGGWGRSVRAPKSVYILAGVGLARSRAHELGGRPSARHVLYRLRLNRLSGRLLNGFYTGTDVDIYFLRGRSSNRSVFRPHIADERCLADNGCVIHK